MCRRWFFLFVVMGVLVPSILAAENRLPGTELLGQLPAKIVAVQHRQVLDYLQRRIAAARHDRDEQWKLDFSSPEAYARSLEQHRANCRRMLGLSEEKVILKEARCELLAETDRCRIERVTIPTDAGVSARGVLFRPRTPGRHCLVIVCADATTWPEALAGLTEGGKPPLWLASLIARGSAVYLPQSVERLQDHAYCQTLKGKDRRMILYRLGYVVGRTMPGLDVQDTTVALDWLVAQADIDPTKIAMAGIEQGAMTALYTAALDQRVGAVVVADYFQAHERSCDEPVDRRLPGQLLEFGDAELAGLIAPRPLWIVHPQGSSVPLASVTAEAKRAARFYEGLRTGKQLAIVPEIAPEAMLDKSASLALQGLAVPEMKGGGSVPSASISPQEALAARNTHFEERLAWLRNEIERSERTRQQHWGLTTCSQADFPRIKAEMLEDYRKRIGQVPIESTPIRPRTRLELITDRYKGYHVMLDVAEGVEVYGHLLVPRNIAGRAAAVICQHGLNGFPDDLTGMGQVREACYHQFGRRLAEQGYVVFAPLVTHHYLPYDQPGFAKPVNDEARQADSIGMARMAMVVAKTQRALDFLGTLPFVDPKRIGYYGLSYGGHSAIWSSPLVDRLAVTIVSGNFNDQRAKLTSDAEATSYLLHPYEDMYVWNSLNRFTHPELIAMAAPRVVCIEFGQNDGITTPAWTNYAWKQTAAIIGRLGLADRVTLAHFNGQHEIHGVETFDVLDRWLRPGQTVGRDYRYELNERQTPSIMGAFLTGVEPFVLHKLDAQSETRLAGSFWIPQGAKEFRGMAVKLSRVGHPGSLQARFGSAPGQEDLGVVQLEEKSVLPLFESFEELRVAPRSIQEGTVVYYELRATGDQAPSEHYYYVYGPKPMGGEDLPQRFGLSYRVLTDRPQDTLVTPSRKPAFDHIQQMLRTPYYQDDPSQRLPGGQSCRSEETAIDPQWSIHHGQDVDGVLATAADDLRQFLAVRCGIRVRVVGIAEATRGARLQPAGHDRIVPHGERTIQLLVRDDPELRKVISTEEGYRVEVDPQRVVVSAMSPRGVMRGVYWIEEQMKLRGGPYLGQGATDRNCRFRRRLTRSVHIAKTVYMENSHPLVYSPELLRHISHQGFNAIYVWTNLETMATQSKVFPELDDPNAPANYARLKELIAQAKPLGIDVFCHLATNHHHPVSEEFYRKHPDCRGVAFANSMCTSNPEVRRYLAESIRHLFQFAPGLKGVDLIYDCEGFMHCGLGGKQQQCPRCRDRKLEEIVGESLATIYAGMKEARPDGEMIAWNYMLGEQPWVRRMLPLLPKGMIVQFDFSKGASLTLDGIQHTTGDYNITTLGPPPWFAQYYTDARKAGLKVMTKTEHAISQEFTAVPYIPCLRQWHDRCEKMAQFELDGIFGNWLHYGYTPSRPAEILMWYSWTGAPPLEQLLQQMARRDFGEAAAPHVTSAWEHFTRGIQQYPYSDPVARYPGPIQKGPSQPLFLDPAIKNYGPCRAWQNDLVWTAPWGPELTARQFRRVEEEFRAGIVDLEQAAKAADPVRRPAIEAERRVVEMMCRSVHTILNLIAWIPIRDAYAAEPPGARREELRTHLIAIGRDELDNARSALVVAEADSRLGASSEGDGLQRGGVFTPALISRKIGMLEDVLKQQLGD